MTGCPYHGSASDCYKCRRDPERVPWVVVVILAVMAVAWCVGVVWIGCR